MVDAKRERRRRVVVARLMARLLLVSRLRTTAIKQKYEFEGSLDHLP